MKKFPWEKTRLEVRIINVYGAEIVGAHNSKYIIEFRDEKMEVVSDEWLKREFGDFPYEIGVGANFGIVLYKEDEGIKMGFWPSEKYWNQELLEE